MAVLKYADVNTARDDWAGCGPSPDFNDSSNHPEGEAEWDHQRDLRAELIRWLFVDPEAIKWVDPAGIHVLGARVTGVLNLQNVRAPYGLALLHCKVWREIHLEQAEIAYLDLTGSHTGPITASGSHIGGFVSLDRGFEAEGEVEFGNSRIGGDFDCRGGRFRHSSTTGDERWADEKPALFLGVAVVQGPIWLSDGFNADGSADINGVTCVSVFCNGGKFLNPGRAALNASHSNIADALVLGRVGGLDAMEADGLVLLDNTKVGGLVYAAGVRFLGQPGERHGLSAYDFTVGGGLVLNDLVLKNGATLDLRASSVNGLVDDEKSWPVRGALAIDGFVYHDFYGGPTDATSRLRWVALGSGAHPSWLAVPSGFHPQPYRELAKVLRERGDESGAQRVEIAVNDELYARRSFPLRMWGGFLRLTIGYGHAPLRAVLWSLAIVVVGLVVVRNAKIASVMRPTYPENVPSGKELHYQELYPLLYSLDVFLPFVNLHQEHYWWPDDEASGPCTVLGYRFSVRGSFVQYYLWFHIIAGWLLSAIFVAGVTGLIRND